MTEISRHSSNPSAIPPGRILVTGAGGRLGNFVRPILRAAGYQLVPTDVRGVADDPEFRVVNLLDDAAVRELVKGCVAVVHLGNHSSQMSRPPVQLFNENVAMNMNVFNAAREAGIRRIIFASTIQVVASEWVPDHSLRRPRIAYLPLDSDSPPDPTNTYALSKRVGEMILDQWATEMDLQAASLRLPYLFDLDHPKMDTWRQRAKEPTPTTIAQGFSWLSDRDAAELIAALLKAQLPGARIYLPASPTARITESLDAIVKKYYSDVPRKSGQSVPLSTLVDISRITQDTGWVPRDLVF